MASDKKCVNDVRQMGITHADFFRLLPRAMGDNEYRLDGQLVHVTLEHGTATIFIDTQKERKLSKHVIMPYADVTFSYFDVPDHVRVKFERYFHLRYMRGLG